MIAYLIAVLLVGLLLSPASAADEPRVLWSRTAGSALFGVAVAGPDTFASGTRRVRGVDALVVRAFDGAGRVLWARTWRPPAGSTQAEPWARGRAIAVGPDGVIYVGGTAAHGCASDEGSWFLRAYGPGGDLRWHREARQPSSCDWRARSSIDDVAVRSSVLATARNVCGGDYCDGFVDVFATDGRARRAVQFEPVGPATETADRANGVAVGPGAAIYTTGWVAMRARFDPSPDYEIAVTAVAADGRLVWSRILRDRGAPDVDVADDVSARHGLLAIVGHEQRNRCRVAPDTIRLCPVVVGMNTAGDVEWRWRSARQLTGDRAAVTTSRGPRITAVWTRNDSSSEAQHVFLVRLDGDGARSWTWTQRTAGFAVGIAATSDRLSVAGWTDSMGTVWRFAAA